MTIYWNGQEQLQQIAGGNGFASENDRRLHFGLASKPRIERIVIHWPSGRIQALESWKIGQVNRIKEPA